MRTSGGISWSTVRFGALIFLIILLAETIQTRNLETEERTYFRRKRQISCDLKYSEITTGHSACLPESRDVKDQGVEDGDKQIIVDIHNTVRREVSPTATNMMLMSWDDSVANIAQRWASNCRIQHDENYKRYEFGRFSVGQNLAWGSWKMDWSEAIKLWSDEKADYSYSSNTSPTRKAVGHYTQMVWATSAKIGCGYAQCGSTHYYVCNYGPGGNSQNQRPYESGNTCNSCPGNCNNGLCDCKGLLCLNGGSLDLKTCTCECTRNLPFFLSPSCGLNCTGIKDPLWCNQYGTAGCERYTNVPQECPVMCRWCPYADFKPSDVIGGTNRVSSSVFTSLAMVFIYVFCYM